MSDKTKFPISLPIAVGTSFCMLHTAREYKYYGDFSAEDAAVSFAIGSLVGLIIATLTRSNVKKQQDLE